jgi:hypothetical protein
MSIDIQMAYETLFALALELGSVNLIGRYDLPYILGYQLRQADPGFPVWVNGRALVGSPATQPIPPPGTRTLSVETEPLKNTFLQIGDETAVSAGRLLHAKYFTQNGIVHQSRLVSKL